ncbi:glycerophosphodiester phosphodiesterase family protein [Aeromicrobium marinum DSM 15272]|uniref:glycerophosphodiester phosphodiesterase n=1 Tax=Aeromicrobium marinum DSM 15272 TaxID=585531 RepID=E2SG05_9ACTN|nr:glycerophosphodiester phosphodiesterase family protein [Aeromicrobium marinum]EFQ81952.1 glycerophosphodiester phosphodiesterase family protein [Aeromicrobium marinum DSM 15272]
MTGPIVIAHRGMPGERLEHTRASYELAVAAGCDYIEPDVVATGDGHLVVRHENEIGHTTDVADHPEFAERRTTKFVNGVPRTGWFTEDFTLAEIKTLTTSERLPQLRPQNIGLAGVEPVLTLDEVIAIARAGGVGVYVETKLPSYFRRLGLDLDDLLLETLQRHDLNRVDADVPVIVQSFETSNLQGLRDRTPLPLVQLIDRQGAPWDFVVRRDRRTYASLTSKRELSRIAEYADGIGPNKSLVIRRDRDYRLTHETKLVRRAHQRGLMVHIWTMRDENNFLPTNLRLGPDVAAHGDARAEYLAFYAAGVDGTFSDFTRTALAAREEWLRSPTPTGRSGAPSA